MYYQQPNNQPPNTYYPPSQQEQFQPSYQPPMMPPQAQRPVRMKVKVACILCFAGAAMVGMAGVPAFLPIAALLLLASFVLIFLI